jgi:hypothetical protein
MSNVEYSRYFVRCLRDEYYRHSVGRLAVNNLGTLSSASSLRFFFLSGVSPSITAIFIRKFQSQCSRYFLRNFTNEISP